MASKFGRTVLLVAGGMAVAALLVYFCIPHPKHTSLAKVARRPYVKPDLHGYVAAHNNDKNPVVQDKVGEAEMHLAFSAANKSWTAPKDAAVKTKSFEEARTSFLAAAKTKGEGNADPNYGTIQEQAAYQAAVCLVAENKPDQATKEFEQFMRDRPLSPLCKACYDRLNRINGKHTDEADGLYQSDLKAQEKRVRFEVSVCGPKAIEALLPLVGKPKKSYVELAKLCGTTDGGTSIAGMRRALKSLGLESFGVELNAPDFAQVQTPALLLKNNHYLVLKSIKNGKAEIYDPTTKKTTLSNLPKNDDAEFTATVLTLTVPRLGDVK
jgi:hypothetical protein